MTMFAASATNTSLGIQRRFALSDYAETLVRKNDEIKALKASVARLQASSDQMAARLQKYEQDFSGSKLTAEKIIREISRLHDVPVALMKGPRRSRKLVFARHHAMYEVTRRCDWLSYPDIGRIFGGRDHTSILHAVRAWPSKAKERGLECIPFKKQDMGRVNLTLEEKRSIITARRNGESLSSISTRFEVSRDHVKLLTEGAPHG